MAARHTIPLWWGFALFFSWVSAGSIQAQCNPPDQLPTVDCADAPLVCLLNACYETLNLPGTGPNGFCGPNTSIQNPQYFQFIPTASTVEIHIHVDNCDMGSSLQSAILDACPWDVDNVLDCNPGTGPGGTMVLQATGLVIGQIYWLMIDGFSGAFCNYTITYTENLFSPGFGGESLTSGEASPDYVCQGYNGVFLSAEPGIANAHGYFWVLEWSGDTITSTPPNTTLDIPEDVPPGVYEICVKAFSGCDTSDMDFCFDIEIYEIPPEDKEPETFCHNDFPFPWFNVTITGEGEYEQSFMSPEGCIFDSIWMVEQYPIPDEGIIDTVYCLPEGETTFYYEGEPYDNPGTYDLFYPDADINGCDSMAELNLTLIGIDAFVELSCDNGEFVLTSYTQELIPFNADIEYFWYNAGTLVSDVNPFLTLVDGCYDLWVNVVTPEGACEFFIETYCFIGSDYYPPPPELPNNDTLLCAQSGIFFCVVPDPFGEPNLEYVWTAPFNVPVFQDGSECVEMDFSVSTGGQVCVYAIGECGQGPESCFEVDIISTPVASFDYDLDVCVDSTMTITFTGSASANAMAVWDFGNPSSVVGSGFGPYMVTWSVPGPKVIDLMVIEPGCDTAFTTAIVSVSNLLAPVINCFSTIDSVAFDWNDVNGASQYLVSINGGPPVMTTVSEYGQGGLAPGTMLTMTLTVVSAGACDDIVLMYTCTAEDCPPPTIILSGQDTACLNQPTIIDLDAEVNGAPGTGVWSGPGIIDPAQGLFDPVLATSGQHQLTYTVDVNGCPYNQPYTITVFDSITADFTLDPTLCITDVANLQYTGNASDTATFNYNFGTAMIISGSGEGPYELNWNTAGQKTIRLQVEENGCVSDVVTHTADVVNTLAAPSVGCAPNTSGVVFTWTIDGASPGETVDVLTGQTGTLNGNMYTFTGLNPGDTVRIEIITQSAGPCPARTDTFFCVAKECPPISVDIAAVADICLYPGTGSVMLDVTVTNATNGTGQWMGPGVTGDMFNPHVAGAGNHLITYNFTEDGCDFSDNITIRVFDIPSAHINTANLQLTCASPSLFLDGTGSTGNNLQYQWTTMGGSILSGSTSAMAEAGRPGVYQLLVTNGVTGCKDSISVTVTQDANIPICDPGPNRTITCDSTIFTLGGNSTSGQDIIYSWSTANGNIIGPSNGPTVLADQTGMYTLVVRDTVTGCQSSGVVDISIDTAVAQITLTPGDTIDCNTPVSTASATLSEPVNDYILKWSTPDGNIQGPDSIATISISQGGIYTLTIHHKGNGCEASANVMVEESDEIIDDVLTTVTNVRCFGEGNGSITIDEVIGGIPDYTYTWSVSPGGGTSLTMLSPGLYSLTVSDANGCSFTEVYTISEPPRVTLDIGPNLTVAAGDSVRIDLLTNLSQQEIGMIDWGGYDGILCPGCPSFQFVATTSATILAAIADTAGCTALDSMRLTVIVPRIIFIPNIFSPNGDGVNDFFTIWGRFNLINIARLKIYDRWGNQLFEDTDLMPGQEEEGWDGSFRGKPMQPGVYVFVAELVYEDISETVSGSFTLVR
jgi:gliding motility-associated-like protein